MFAAGTVLMSFLSLLISVGIGGWGFIIRGGERVATRAEGVVGGVRGSVLGHVGQVDGEILTHRESEVKLF